MQVGWPETRLGHFLRQLALHYGAIARPAREGPFEMILWEMVAYLTDDSRRAAAFSELKRRVGLTPGQILAASTEELTEIARLGGSIAASTRAGRMQVAARIAEEEFDGDLFSLLHLPLQKAKKHLMRFPMIGEPGAEKILLFCGALPVLALESNGLRVLLRLGVAEEKKSYTATYKAIREQTLRELPDDIPMLQQAHLLLRRHGQELCRASEPACRECPVSDQCPGNTLASL